MNKYTVQSEEAGQRLDKFSVNKLTNLSRSKIQKLIKAGEILVNGQKAIVHQFLKTGDVVSIKEIEATKVKEVVKIVEVPIVKQTADYLVIDKPAGLVVHPVSAEDTQPSVVDFLLAKFPQAAKVGEDPLRPGIVHRLDKDVSGLMVLALTQAMFDHLKQQFKQHATLKEYLALVYGLVTKDEGEIKLDIGWSKRHPGKLVARPTTGQEEYKDKTAITYFWVEKRIKNYTLLRLQSKTGRTHQLRLHLKAYGYPIVGDELYGQPEVNKRMNLGRIFLQACKLGFTDLQGEYQEFAILLPIKLKEFLNKI